MMTSYDGGGIIVSDIVGMVRGFQEGLSQWRARQGQVCGDVLENVPQVKFSILSNLRKDQ